MTPYGPLVTVVEDILPGMKLAIQNPAAFLHMACEREGFANLMRATMQKHPFPWTIVLYADGISPADALAKHDQRKLQAVYYSFLEFGEEVLCTEEVWCVLVAVRDKKLEKGMPSLSVVLSGIFDRFFFSDDDDGVNFERTGVMVPLGDEPVCFRARVGMVVADEPALHDIFGCKGHAGYKPNAILSNVVLSKFYNQDRAMPDDVMHTCVDPSLFKYHTADSLRALLGWLGTKQGQDLKDAEVYAGWNYHPDMFALRPYIDVPNTLCFEPMHLYLQGILDSELGELMHMLHKSRGRVNYHTLGNYVELWQWPKCISA